MPLFHSPFFRSKPRNFPTSQHFLIAMPPTEQNQPPNTRERFPLPCVIGAIGFLIYCLTLSYWASLSSIAAIARVSGWTWQPELSQPLTCALLYPFRLLPQTWLPFALNLFTAICAALVLALLARSVILLGQVARVGQAQLALLTAPINSKMLCWLPPLLAAAICALQLSFWEHATAFSGEMLDLLIFAYVIRCLLEFRNDERDSWLFRSAFLYSAGMANNWAMLGYFPLYVLAVLLVKRLGFKRLTKPPPPRKPRQPPQWLRNLLAKIGIRHSPMPKPVYAPFRPVVLDTTFFLRMALWGLAGLSFYFLLPIVQSLSSHSSISFWEALRANLTFQKNHLNALRSPSFRLLAIASLLPILVLAIGWKTQPANSGYETRRAIFLNRLASYPLHTIVLFLTLWLSFDPSFSPRHLALGIPMLSYYYLSALVAGYCVGYLLQVVIAGSPNSIVRLIPVATCVVAVALPLLLIARNLGHIRLTNGPSLHLFARDMYADLPSGKSVVLGNDFAQLSFLRAEFAAQNHAKDPLIVELPSLSSAQYHLFMARQFGHRWPVIPPTNAVDLVGPIKLLKLISAFAEHEPVIYLDPNFGPLFDRHADPLTGFIHHFASKSQPGESTREVAPVVLRPDSELAWQQRWTNHLQSLAAHTKTQPKYTQWARPLLSTLRLQNEPNATASFLGAIYSKSLNNWAVLSRRHGHWAEAGEWFRRSLDLNPQNLSAHINSEFNDHWQRGEKIRLDPSFIQKQYADIFNRHNDWREFLSDFGSVDEPTFLFRTGRAFLANGNTRLAAAAFQRSSELAPNWPQPVLWLAQSLLEQRNFAEALDMVERVHSFGPSGDGQGLAQLLHCRATSLRGLGRTNEVAPCIDGFVREHGQHREVLAAAADAYSQNDLHDQQLATIEELLKREPNRPEWLAKKGLAEMQLGRFESAIATLSTALSLAPTDENARLSRAVARLGADQLDAARDDYQQLLNSKTFTADALFGLGTIAWRKHETNAAKVLYLHYLTNGLPASPQANVAIERVRELGMH
jgi:tetratricopeptide (TPR) repeat protein